MKKKTWKTIGIVVAIIALLALVLALVAGAVSSFRERNPKNLIKVDDDYIGPIEHTDNGLTVNVKDDGTIKIKGNPSADEHLIVKTFTLEAGTYTVSGLAKPDINKMVLGVKWGAADSVSTAYAGLSSATFTFAEATEVTVFIDIYKGAEDSSIEWANRTVRPCIVEGDTAGDFYA